MYIFIWKFFSEKKFLMASESKFTPSVMHVH